MVIAIAVVAGLGANQSRLRRCYDAPCGRTFFSALAFPTGSEGLQMMMPQIAAAIVGAATAGGFLVTLAPDFSADFALAVIACFS